MSRIIARVSSVRPATIIRKSKTALRMMRSSGFRGTFRYGRLKLKTNVGRSAIVSMVRLNDILAADWTQVSDPVLSTTKFKLGDKLNVAWVMSPPGAESGGHQNIFRFIKVLESHGHNCKVFLYNAQGNLPSPKAVKSMLKSSDAFADTDADVAHYKESIGSGFDAVFATGWETAYPVFNDPSTARRFYFVQDFEPLFYPMGTDALLAENTYRFNFFGITAGRWLARKLNSDFGMETRHFDFAVDPKRYFVSNQGERNEVFFYSRPVTPRRAFELGVLALTEVHRQRPDVKINLAGWDVSTWDLPFPYNNLGSLGLEELNEVYNRCNTALVLSLTNLSLLPLELAAAGVVPVVNDAPNNTLVAPSKHIAYVPPSPARLAAEVIRQLDSPLSGALRSKMSEDVSGFTWVDSGKQFMRAFKDGMRA